MKTLMMMVAALALSASAETLTWTGGDSGKLTDSTWSASRAPQAGDRLVVPTGKTVTANKGDETLLASLAGIDLAGTFVIDGFDVADHQLPATFTLAGAGSFKVLNCAKRVHVCGDNSAFSGPFVVSNSLFRIAHAKAIGTGPLSVYKGDLASNASYFQVAVAGTFANELYFDEGGGYYGMELWSNSRITWSGPVTCTASGSSSCPRFMCTSGELVFTGGMKGLKGRIDFNGNVLLAGENVTYHAFEDIFCDSGTLRIAAPIDPTTKMLQAADGLKFEKANMLGGLKLKLTNQGNVDLNGFDQTAGDLEVADAVRTDRSRAPKIGSAAPATLTVTGKAPAGSAGVALTGRVSLALDNAATTLTLTNMPGYASSTAGSLEAMAGTLRLGSTAMFAALGELKATGGTIGVDAGARVNADVKLVLSGTGKIDLAADAALKVASATLNGASVAAGTYSATKPGALEGHISGSGTLTVVAMGGETVETLVWQGGNGSLFDSNWLAEGESGEPHAPFAGCRLSVPVGCTVTASGSDGTALPRFKGIALDGEFVCEGFTVDCTLGSDFTLSGSGAFRVQPCTGKLHLKADNSAFTGPFSFLRTKVYVDNVHALGLENVVTASYAGANPGQAYFIVTAGGEYKNELRIDGGSGWWAYRADGCNVVQSGLVRCTNNNDSYCPRFETANGATLRLTGGVLAGESDTRGRADFCTGVTLAGEDVTYRMPGYIFCDSGTLHVEAAIDPATYLFAQATIVFDKANLVSDVKLSVAKGGTFDLNGHDQTTDELTAAAEGTPTFTSVAQPATLTLNGAATGGTLAANLDGHLTFAFDKAGGSVTLANLAGNASATDGKLVAKVGTLRLGSTANFTHLSAVRVENGAVVIDAGAKIAPGARLEFASGGTGTVDLGAGVSIGFETLTLDGAFLPKGTYSAANPGALAGRITGAGEIKVNSSQGEITDPNVFHWVGGHGTSLAEAANWQEQAAPQLKGADILVFTGGTSGAVVAGAVDVYGLVFDGSSDFTLGAGAGASVTLGAGGFSLTNRTLAGTATFTVEPPVVLASPKLEWSVGANAKLALPATLGANDAINLPSATLTVNGAGVLELGGDNSAFLPVFKFTDIALVPILRHPAALGSSDRTVDVRSVPNAHVTMTNLVPFNVYDSYYTPQTRHVLNPKSTHFEQRGKVTFMTSGRTGYLSLYGGTISGGIAAGPDNKSGDVWFQILSPSKPFRIEGEPIDIPGTLTFDNQGRFYLASVGNKWKGLRLNKMILFCEADGVLNPNGELLFTMNNQGAIHYDEYEGRVYGALNLNGHSQSVLVLRSGWNAEYDDNPDYRDCRAIVDSPTPASLTLTGEQKNENLRCQFHRAAGLTYAASGRLNFTKWTSPTTGRLAVESGEFAFDANGGWGGGTNRADVVVSGGMLVVAAGAAETAFGGAKNHTTLSISGDGKIDVADGFTVEVGQLVVDGSTVACGTYGGANSPATADKRYAAKFGSGTGVLKVLRPRGFMVLVR